MKGQDKLQRGYEVFRGGVLGQGRPGVGVQGKVGGGGGGFGRYIIQHNIFTDQN